jgi:hypothetical protein
VQQDDAVAERLRVSEHVRAEEDGLPPLPAPRGTPRGGIARHHVEGGGGLVEDERRRIVYEGAGDVRPLLLAGGELAARAIRELGESEAGHQRLDARDERRLGISCRRPKYRSTSRG